MIPLAERFRRYYVSGPKDACWIWTGTFDRNGYGVISDEKRRQLRAHRVAYEQAHHVHIPEDKYVLHDCDNPACVNPAHLKLGTSADNNRDMITRRRHRFGQRHHRAKITEEQVREIRALYPGMSQSAIAIRYGLDQTTVSQIIRKVNWTHV
jgi:hypothetical protein